MAFRRNAALTQRLMRNNTVLVPLALLYCVLLAASWSPDSMSLLLPGGAATEAAGAVPLTNQRAILFIPELEGISKLFSRPLTAISAWAHLQFINLFCGRWIWSDGVCRLRPPIACPALEVQQRRRGVWLRPAQAHQALRTDAPRTRRHEHGRGYLALHPAVCRAGAARLYQPPAHVRAAAHVAARAPGAPAHLQHAHAGQLRADA